jgi:hypothetical protein
MRRQPPSGGGSMVVPVARIGWLAIDRRHAGHGADHAPTAPLQPPAAQGVGLKADQQIERNASQPQPARIEARHLLHDFESNADGDIANEWPPQAMQQEPERRQQGCGPREAVLDEDKPFAALDPIGQGLGLLVDGVGPHAMGCQGSGLWRCLF